MQNIEKTIQSMLKKFEAEGDYEKKRKLVFWYDKDQTVEDEEELDQIKFSLGENGIKLHILNNNYFETKKLLENDDIQSNYLIYSSKAERDKKSNWLLDIQLYSSRFENSKISDIKSELGIQGYDLDKLLEEHEKFFAKKDRVSAFKRHYQNDWNEDKFVLGMLATLSKSHSIDQKEIVRNLLMSSLVEEKNTIWGEFERFLSLIHI